MNESTIPGRPLPDWAKRHPAVVDMCAVNAAYWRKVRFAWTVAERNECIDIAHLRQPTLPGIEPGKEKPKTEAPINDLPLFA